jgi:hypothetical protein
MGNQALTRDWQSRGWLLCVLMAAGTGCGKSMESMEATQTTGDGAPAGSSRMPPSVTIVHLRPQMPVGALQRVQMNRVGELGRGPLAVRHADGSAFVLASEPRNNSSAAPAHSSRAAPLGDPAPAK